MANDANTETDRDDDTGGEHGWTRRLARHRTGLALLSFAESTVVPIPLETIVVPLMVGHHRRSITIATAIWLGCLVGASLFYFVGLWLADPVVIPALEWLGLKDNFDQMTSDLDSGSLFWTVFLVSFSPAPMQLATLGTGVVGGNFLTFFAAIALSRGLRYFGLAVLARLFGPKIAELGVPTGKLVIGLVVVLLVGWGIMQFI
ncbi:YqaA family protein [Citreimonas sp.]|uniref:YqaA family protein n=1 Tax=Citreimonas sp. TaxID=3036715 RepID=UPI004059B0CF